MSAAFWLSYACGVAALLVWLVGLDPLSGAVGAAVAGVFVGLLNRFLERVKEGAEE